MLAHILKLLNIKSCLATGMLMIKSSYFVTAIQFNVIINPTYSTLCAF